jgi:hypothetical protein
MFHACSINGSIFTEFLNELCGRVKFTFCAHMKQSLLCHDIINTFHQISNISYSPRIVWHQNKSVILTKEHLNHYICKMSLFLRLLYTCLDNLYTIELVISGIAGLDNLVMLCKC